MSALPKGWVQVALQDVALISGGIQKQPKRKPKLNPVPFLRVANVGRGSLDLSDVHEIEVFDGELERYALQPGDLLVVEGNGSPDQIGRAARWRGDVSPCVHQNHLIRVRPTPVIAPAFLEFFWNSPQAASRVQEVASTTSGLYTLSTGKIKSLPVVLPPLAEQERIVEAVEEAFSLLDAGESALHNTRSRLKRMRDSVLTAAVTGKLVPQDPTDTPADKLLADLGIEAMAAVDAFPAVPDTWCWARVVDVGRVDLGRQRHPDWHTGPNMKPYLRVANVFEDRIDTGDVMEMHFEPEVFERFKLHPGDVLLNEGQSPELLGRPALYKSVPADVAFTNSLLRFRAGEAISPEWALLAFRAYMRTGRFTRESRITTNIAHLSAGRLKGIEFPVPPPEEQSRIVAEVDRQTSFIEAAERAVDAGLARSKGLRRAVLKAAFEGRLVEQDPADEPASVLLERIAAERAAVAPTKRAPRAVRGKVVAS